MAGPRSLPDTEFAVVGGGLVGAAIGYGLAGCGRGVTILDEGDIASRASRANFALVWIQTKGLGMARYASWTEASIHAWPGFAEGLKQVTGLDVCYQRPGGFMVCLSDDELQFHADRMKRLQAQPGAPQYAYDVLDHRATKAMLPALGPEVAGSVYCPLDGHVNSLRLLRALHAAMEPLGISYCPEHRVDRISPQDGGFLLSGSWGSLFAQKLVIAAGVKTQEVAAQVGLDVRMRPSKGQVLVTERLAPFLNYPVATVRQTDEGSVLVGDSQEDLDLDDMVTRPVLAVMAERAVKTFPLLAGANVVRTWAGMRVMSADGFPVYAESASHPGAYAAICHSGVTLAAAHAGTLARDISAGALAPDLAPFSTERFHVPTPA